MRRLFIIALIGLCFITCRKTGQINPGVNPQETSIIASVSGRITDEFGIPLKGVSIQAGSKTVLTDINGEFIVNNADLIDNRAFVKASMQGYFPASRTFIARNGQKHYVEIQLIPKTTIGNINASSGGTINTGNGTSITLPANGIINATTGASYTGSVAIQMAWIDPTSPDLMKIMPGALRGIDENGEEKGLETYGMIGVELSGSGGEKLQIASGKQATLKFPLPASLQATAPSSIALWSFNDTTGLWKREGAATRSGNTYVAQVSHFSFWNCDAPYLSVLFSATFKFTDGQPLKNTLIDLKRPGILGEISGHTDSSGFISGMVPQNEVLQMRVFLNSTCSGSVSTQNIGPFTANSSATLGTISISPPQSNNFIITGVANNCAGQPVTNGFLQVKVGNAIGRTPINNGIFSYSFLSCNNTSQIEYYVMDVGANSQSSHVVTNISAGNSNIGTVLACGVSTQQFINFLFDGVAYSLTPPVDSVYGYSQSQLGSSFPLIGGFKSNNTRFNFKFAGNTPGIYSINWIQVQTPAFSDSLPVIPSTPQLVSITEFGSVGGYIAGGFNGVFYSPGAIAHTVQCNFRVRRQQ